MEKPSLRKELSDVSFEDLQHLQKRVGSRAYNEVLFGQKQQNKQLQGDKFHHTLRKNKTKNKDKPLEMSSKIRVSRTRYNTSAKKKITRDPRFDDLSGAFREQSFEKNYGFIKDLQEEERTAVQTALQQEQEENEKTRLEKLLYRMDQQQIAERRKEERTAIKEKLKKQEEDLIKKGKQPFFLKKSDKKKLELAEQYKALKKSGKLEKYLAKRRKKNISKERQQMPSSYYS